MATGSSEGKRSNASYEANEHEINRGMVSDSRPYSQQPRATLHLAKELSLSVTAFS